MVAVTFDGSNVRLQSVHAGVMPLVAPNGFSSSSGSHSKERSFPQRHSLGSGSMFSAMG